MTARASWKRTEEKAPAMLKVLSLGAGVQSTTVLLMALADEIERPDHVLFADTGAEPQVVYDHLAKLEAYSAERGLPVERLSIGRSLKDDVASRWECKDGGGKRFVTIPAFTTVERGERRGGQLRRQCTAEFKIDPIDRRVRELAGITRFRGTEPVVEQWFGISLDEIRRMRLSPHKWSTYYYPIVDLRMTRDDCKRWLSEHGWPNVPRSACIMCPYKTDPEWRLLHDSSPAEWSEAVRADRLLRTSEGMRGEMFIHRSLKPLEDVDLSTASDHGQQNLFDACCEGMCGT